MQNNTWDCGVFVCRYASAIFKLRNRSFKYRDVDGNSPFSRVVTGGAEFDFDMDDIVRFRSEFQTLIERLSGVYSKWKRGGEKTISTNESEKKISDQEVNDETQEVEKEASTSTDEGKDDEGQKDAEVTGSTGSATGDSMETADQNGGASAERPCVDV